MPVIYFSEIEYKDMKSNLEIQINELCLQIRTLQGKPCRQANDHISCGDCQFSTHEKFKPRCTSDKKYFCK